MEKVGLYDGVELGQQSRRWWTDNAPVFKAASAVVRSFRALGHFASIPHKHQSNGIIERQSRMIIEGINTCLRTSGMTAKWWVCAAPFWTTMKNAFVPGKDGETDWRRRFCSDPMFTQYPYGALVFLRLSKELENEKTQFQPRMIPHLLVGIGLGPGCIWDKTYMVVKLSKLIGDQRASRVNIRRSTDLMFPAQPRFPLQIKLKASGALGDDNLPGPAVSGSNEEWGLHNDGEDTDAEVADGMLGESRPRLIDSLVGGVMM